MAGFIYAGESSLNLCAPTRASGSPAQPQKLFPALLGSIAAQVFPPLEKGGLTVGHFQTDFVTNKPTCIERFRISCLAANYTFSM